MPPLRSPPCGSTVPARCEGGRACAAGAVAAIPATGFGTITATGGLGGIGISSSTFSTGGDFTGLLTGCHLLIAAGAAQVQFLKEDQWIDNPTLKVAIDLNAVPPTGVEGIGVTDKAKERGKVLCYGAIGVGGAKMKVHRAAVEALFEQHDRVLNTAEVFAIAEKIG